MAQMFKNSKYPATCAACKREIDLNEGRYVNYVDGIRYAWCLDCGDVLARPVSSSVDHDLSKTNASYTASVTRNDDVVVRVPSRSIEEMCDIIAKAFLDTRFSLIQRGAADMVDGKQYCSVPDDQIASLAATAFIQWCREAKQ